MMKRNLKTVIATSIAATMLLVPVLAQAADPSEQASQPQQTNAISTQGMEPSAQSGECNGTGPMTHGHWTLEHSAEYGGDCTLTFTATDPFQENDFKGLETRPGTTTPFRHIKDLHLFAYAKHIVFDGVNMTQLPENSAFLFGDWDPTSNHTYLKTFKGNGLVDTSHVKNMEGIFQGDRGMTSLDLSGWDTSNVTSMRSMFDGIPLASLDVADFDTHNVTDMNHMFYNACNIHTLDLSKWDTSKLDFTINPNGKSNTDDMFCRVNRLTVGPKTRLSSRSFRGNPVASVIHARPSPGASYTDKWIKVSHLSNGTSGTTEPLINATAQSQDDFTGTLANDPNRAGTYVWQTAPLRTLNLQANPPSGYTATAGASGFTTDGDGNLSTSSTNMTVNDVPMPQFDTDGEVISPGTPSAVNTLDPDVALPAGNPFTLTAASPTSDTYTLLGWSATPGATTADHALGSTVNVASCDVTLYAVWQKVEPATPSEPSEPTTPSGPSTPSTPSEPTTPSVPSEPSTPSEPTTPSTPSEPMVPSAPSASSTPSAPTAPSEPTAPNTTPSSQPQTPTNTSETSGSTSSTSSEPTSDTTMQAATPAPAVNVQIAPPSALTLAPVAAPLTAPAALTVAAPATPANALAAGTVAPNTNGAAPNAATGGNADHNVGGTPQAATPVPQQKTCEVAYYGEGSVAPAAIICKSEGRNNTASTTPSHIASTVLAPAWLFMLAFAVLLLFAMFLYQRRNEFLAAQHRAMESD